MASKLELTEKEKAYMKVWETLDEDSKVEFRDEVNDRLQQAMHETYLLVESGKIAKNSYKKIMDEWVAQNPMYSLFIKTGLK